MNKIFQRIAIPLTFLIAPFTVFALPAIKDVTIACVQLCAESWLLIQLVLLFREFQKSKQFNLGIILMSASIFCAFLADLLYCSRLTGIINNYGLIPAYLYTGFATLLLLFSLNKLDIFTRSFHEWGWIFVMALLIDSIISYWFLFSPYYHIPQPLAYTINGTLYMTLTIFIFAIILPFAFRVTDRKIFWFLNFLLLLLTADFAIRYQNTLSNTITYSWVESAWCTVFIGLAWLLHFSQNKHELFIPQPLELAPFISIRSLLTLSICGANTLLLFCILAVKLYSFKTTVDISSVFLLLFVFWTIANEFSIWLANDLSRTLKYMFKSKEHLATDGMIHFNLEQVTAQNPIFEIAKILESYNGLVAHTNKTMGVVQQTNVNATIAEVSYQVSHDIRSPLAALEVAAQTLPILPEDMHILIQRSIGRIKDIVNNLLQKNPQIYPISIPDKVSPATNDTKSIQLLSRHIDVLISEKRLQYRANTGIEISSMPNENSLAIFSEVNITEFMRLLSNLVNNAVEAIVTKGQVTIGLTQINNYAVISITDNGRGISPKILNELGQRGETHGKSGGSGLGLYHARKTVESWNGSISIDSTLGVGTCVCVMLPFASEPDPNIDLCTHIH